MPTPELTYDYLTPEERVALIDQALARLENRHFQTRLRALETPEDTSYGTLLDDLTQRIEELRTERNALVPANG